MSTRGPTASPGTAAGGSARDAAARRLTSRVSIVLLVAVYVPLALAYSLMTPAWEGDDEVDHTSYVEFIERNGAIPRIDFSNGIESHQPPLYYLVVAAWQHVLSVPSFTPSVSVEPDAPLFDLKSDYDGWLHSHDYTPRLHDDAVHVHQLRLISVLFGLGTVLLSYAAAKLVGMREALAFSVGMFVALLPKELQVTSLVTNDALVILLCAAALVWFLLAERAREAQRLGRRRLFVFALGLALGAAALTKFNSLPIAFVLIALLLLPALIDRRRVVLGPALIDTLVAVGSFFAVSGWWFVRNHQLYGELLAKEASQRYLTRVFIEPWPWNADLFLEGLPRALTSTGWYGYAYLQLPGWMNHTFNLLALASVLCGAWVLLFRRRHVSSSLQTVAALSIPGCVVGAVVAALLVLQTGAPQAARVVLVGLPAFAILNVAGAARIVSSIRSAPPLAGVAFWPVSLLALELYVLCAFVIPLRGL